MHHHDHGLHDNSEQKNITIAFILNFSFSIIEMIGGVLTGSVAILSSALHDLGDSISLGLAYVLVRKSNRDSNKEFSYGYRRYSLLSALITGLILVVGSTFVLWEAVPKLLNPTLPDVKGMMGFAIFGLSVNGFLAYRLSHGSTMNEKVISWHLFEDVMGWAMVLLTGVLIYFIKLPILDPIVSVAYTLYILFGVGKTLSKTVKLFLQAAPETVDINKLNAEISSISGVKGFHDTHIWSLDGKNHVLTMHIIVKDETSLEEAELIKTEIRKFVERLGPIHTTIEIESESKDCPELNCVKGLPSQP